MWPYDLSETLAPTQVRGQLAFSWLQSDDIFPDVNRERVISQDYLPYIIKQLRSDELVDLAISVLFNICMDYGEWVIDLGSVNG